jgi:hypothetical protein
VNRGGGSQLTGPEGGIFPGYKRNQIRHASPTHSTHTHTHIHHTHTNGDSVAHPSGTVSSIVVYTQSLQPAFQVSRQRPCISHMARKYNSKQQHKEQLSSFVHFVYVRRKRPTPPIPSIIPVISSTWRNLLRLQVPPSFRWLQSLRFHLPLIQPVNSL